MKKVRKIYTHISGHAKLRTHDKSIKHANIAHDTNNYGKQHSECGVKRLNWLYIFKGFDKIKGVGIDYMHLILGGVVMNFSKHGFLVHLN